MATKLTKYEPSMCDRIVELGKTGASQKMIWSDLGISSGTAANYKKKYPEFAEALDMALVHSQAYWERELITNVNNKAFNSRVAEIAMRGQFSETYRETRENKVDAKVEVVVDFSAAVTELITSLKKASEAS